MFRKGNGSCSFRPFFFFFFFFCRQWWVGELKTNLISSWAVFNCFSIIDREFQWLACAILFTVYTKRAFSLDLLCAPLLAFDMHCTQVPLRGSPFLAFSDFLRLLVAVTCSSVLRLMVRVGVKSWLCCTAKWSSYTYICVCTHTLS